MLHRENYTEKFILQSGSAAARCTTAPAYELTSTYIYDSLCQLSGWMNLSFGVAAIQTTSRSLRLAATHITAENADKDAPSCA